MSDQPGFREPEPQQSPDYHGSQEPYPQPSDEVGHQQGGYDQPGATSQTERMPTYPPSAPEPYAQPSYGGQPSQPAYGEQTPPAYGAGGYAQPTTPPYGADYGQPTQNPYGADYGQAPYGHSAPQPYGAAGYGQPYGQPAYGYQQPEHPQATTILVLGILGFFVPIVPFVAWYMGGQIKKEIDAGAPYQWEGQLKIGYLIGKILGIIQIASVVLTIVWLIFMFGLFATRGF